MKRKIINYTCLIIILFFLLGSLYSQTSGDMVNIAGLDSTIVIDLRYATDDNFLGDTLYSANICLLRRDVAERLVKVHQYLRQKKLGLKIWDGYRPLSVQKKMWAKLPDPKFVADPKRGSNHNRGAAVDVTLVDLNGNELEMPTGFDDFSERARINYDKVSRNAKKNRAILQQAMKRYGFKTINSEWWHFNDKDMKKYLVIDVPLEIYDKQIKREDN